MGIWPCWRAPYSYIATIVVASLALPSASDHAANQHKRQIQSNITFFHHRARQSSVVVGKYLWIHGGDLTTWNGTGSGCCADNDEGNVHGLPSNNTYSIDLSSSWTNATVGLTSIHSTAPTLVSQALWVDPSGTSFYAYDGGLSYELPIPEAPPNQLWQFTPSGNSGNWSQVGPPASSNFTTLVRGYAGIYTSGGGLGFALGGVENGATTNSFQGTGGLASIPGMVMYNLTSQEWYNISASGYSNSGVATQGAAHFVPSFGPAGLLFIFGGSVANETLIGTDSVSIFDPFSQQWSSQEVSGTKPSPVVDPCVVGVQGDNNTYEIFLYGGNAADIEATIAQGAVYVLSLPAFNWQKQDVTPGFGRHLHSCNVIGNRQMVSIGGMVTNSTASSTDGQDIGTPDQSLPDPWQQGLGIFDLTAMEWKEEYDSDAAPYMTPDAVKAYYQQNGRDPVSWTNDVVQTWFTKTELNHTNNNSIPSTTRQPGSSGSNTGVIAGGTVGGVLALAFIAILASFLLRRRHRKDHLIISTSDTEYRKPELAVNGNSRMSGVNYPPSELQGVNHPNEMPQREVATSELPSWERPKEAAGSPLYEM